MSKQRTITLTDRPPVTIDEDAWPTIASATDCDDRAIPSQANRDWGVRVRQHADGRRIVYGHRNSARVGEGGLRAGQLTDEAGTVDAIHAVAEAIGHPEIAADCIADLPAEVLR